MTFCTCVCLNVSCAKVADDWSSTGVYLTHVHKERSDYHPSISSYTMDEPGPSEDKVYEKQRRVLQRLHHYIALFIAIILNNTSTLLLSLREPESYHTSILTGEGWVLELLAGHSERIRCELGVRRHVFLELIQELQRLGHDRSKYVSLKEQLAIFLYISVTGMTIRHAGERFQRSNETISR